MKEHFPLSSLRKCRREGSIISVTILLWQFDDGDHLNCTGPRSGGHTLILRHMPRLFVPEIIWKPTLHKWYVRLRFYVLEKSYLGNFIQLYVEFNVRVSVHRYYKYSTIENQQDAPGMIYLLLISSTCFGRRFRPSSGAYHCNYSFLYCIPPTRNTSQ